MGTQMVNRLRSLARLKAAEHRIKKAYQTGKIDIDFGPSSLNLMMIDSCNSQCIMCGRDYQSCGTKAYLSLQDIRTIYSHLDMDTIVDVIYGGGGEPFLNPDLAEIASFTRQIQPAIQHTVITNFLQWKEQSVGSIVDAGVNFLISINAASPGTFRHIAGVDAFEQVVDHAQRLIQLRKDLRSRVHVALSMVIMRHNIDELVDFVRLARQIGADEVKTLYVRIYPENQRIRENRQTKITPDDSLFHLQEKSDEMVAMAHSEAKKAGIRFEHEPLFSCSKPTERNCCEAWKSLFINFNGDVYPCPASEILFKPKVDSGEYQSGNILKEHINDFWNNQFWQALRETNRQSKRRDLFPECQCCGNSINWWGSQAEKAHVLDWSVVRHK